MPVSEAGQLIVTLDGLDLDCTVTGRAAGTTSSAATLLVETATSDAVLAVQNPAGHATSLTISPLAGGTRPVSASLLIESCPVAHACH